MNKHRMKSSFPLYAPQQTAWKYEVFDDFTMKSDQHFTNAEFNFQQLVVRHSPTGMNWGYGGSGPSDCALNILLNYISEGTGLVTEDEEDFINCHYQSFKQKHVANVAKEGGMITLETVQEFVTSLGFEEAA